MQKDMAILDMPVRNLASAWERCIQAAIPAKIAVEDELTKPRGAHVCLLGDYYCNLADWL
jgi:ubiquitin carboxyl-terminal hydrolase L5